MQVEQQYTPVAITLETSNELSLFWDIIEEAWQRYPENSTERAFLIELSNNINNVINT